MTVRTCLLIAMVVAPVAWGAACHDGDSPGATNIPPDVQRVRSQVALHDSVIARALLSATR